MKTREDTDSSRIILRLLEGIRTRCPSYIPVLESLGDLYTRRGMVKEGLEIDLQLTGAQPEHETYWYNLACSYCLDGQWKSAMEALQKAVELGYDDAQWMAHDDDLKALRHHPAFAALLASLRDRQNQISGPR